jgi:hypothetical protein
MTKRITALVALALFAAACTGGATASPTPTPSATTSPTVAPSPTVSPSPSASPSASPASGLYLRAWQTQALPPPSSFLTGPMLTVSDGVLIDNNVAIPMIFPGPLLILPNASPITADGEKAIVEQARELGLLDGPTDFTAGSVMPGGVSGHLLLTAEGTTYELMGNPDKLVMCNDKPCPVDPGSPEAFAAFWWLLQNTSSWLGGNLGPSAQYQPERLAVLVVAPAAANGGIATNEVAWPLTDFATFGVPLPGGQAMSCATVFGDDLSELLPVLRNANQMTVFVDSTGAKQSLNVRALVPQEPSPCPDQA